MAGNEGNYVPKYLNAQPQFLWWEADEATVLFVGLFCGSFFHRQFIALILSWVVMKIYAKLKYGKQDGFFHHWLYAYGLKKIPQKIPPYWVKEFVQ